MTDLDTPADKESHKSPVCPDCGENTRPGIFTLGQTWAGAFFAGSSMPHLFFNEGSKRKSQQSIFSWEENLPRVGWCCPVCGFAMIRSLSNSKAMRDREDRKKAETAARQPPRDEWWKKYY